MPLFDAFYMTIITISTVGFSEVKPLSSIGRIITILIISTGITIGAYTIGMLLRMLIEGELSRTFGRKKLEKSISVLKAHWIICGFGRIGTIICQELQSENIPFVVIEEDPSRNEELENEGYLYINMDATSEEALIKAGIMQAREGHRYRFRVRRQQCIYHPDGQGPSAGYLCAFKGFGYQK